MLTVSDISLQFSDRKLFDEVNIKFTPGNCYGLIGANGAGKSTFLKILDGEIQPTTGHISMGPNERMSVLRQNHYDYEDQTPLDVVMMGNEKLFAINQEKNAIYMNPDATEDDFMQNLVKWVVMKPKLTLLVFCKTSALKLNNIQI